MKPIGLVTCYFHHNYGSMLQAYATEVLMQKMGLPYKTIACKAPIQYMKVNKLEYIIKKLLVSDWNMWLGKRKIAKTKKRLADTFGKNVDLRDSYFDYFANNYFKVSPLCKNRTELETMARDYSAFLVGSDQLWRTDSVEHGYYTLEWVPDEIPKIAYSTSIGVKEIPWFQVTKNRRFMNRFENIALREKSACDIVEKLTGRKVEVVLDPTLLLRGDEWMCIQKEESLTDGKYIFCYLLGNNPQQRKLIQEVKAKTGYKIVALQHLDDYIPSDEDFADEAPYNVGPPEFLNYIRNAEYVFTDSFHCSIFSTLYKRNFFTFSRFTEGGKQSTNTRIDNLLSILGLEDRRINNDKNADFCLSYQYSFDGIDAKLDKMRKSSFDYLNMAFKELIVKNND